MAYNVNDMRASHTIRIFGTNKKKEVIQDIWLDIERIDVYRITTKSPTGQFQGVYRWLKWLDDPENDPPDDHPIRSEGLLKICSPDEEDQEDPEEWIPVRTIIEMAWKDNTETALWNVRRGNRTDAENEARLVQARRVVHRDTTIDDDVDAATANNPDLKAYVVASDQYDFKTDNYDDPDDDTKDEDTFIEVQFVSCTIDTSNRKEDADKTQIVQTSLKNHHYLRFTEEAKGPVNKNHGFDPPWALDIFQAIVNVQWGELAVEFGDKGLGPDDLPT